MIGKKLGTDVRQLRRGVNTATCGVNSELPDTCTHVMPKGPFNLRPLSPVKMDATINCHRLHLFSNADLTFSNLERK